jgi:hypothetical protein
MGRGGGRTFHGVVASRWLAWLKLARLKFTLSSRSYARDVAVCVRSVRDGVLTATMPYTNQPLKLRRGSP